MEAVATQTSEAKDTSTDKSATSRSVAIQVPKIGTIGRFQLRAALGGGAFGVVYRAYDPVLTREVALKVPRFGTDEKRKLQRFLTEAQAAANPGTPD